MLNNTAFTIYLIGAFCAWVLMAILIFAVPKSEDPEEDLRFQQSKVEMLFGITIVSLLSWLGVAFIVGALINAIVESERDKKDKDKGSDAN